ncbi:hypothetical protein [Pseudoclavibacter sp. VKM Ac-2888]|uniref:hypothetical protein n=1 Tax=Pseudoclavibacter sp. VKM Ac-2888 TaxID=2783830 RepID=UPI00188C9EB9|nr:hypothetical protein [Pseudoclavibacter sp. VKM Ac-2888]MBF4549227.1 hypothetical protein [Pseudoclavibacter sp. VKM Ac-2888]
MSEVVWEDLGEARAMDDPSATSLMQSDTMFRRSVDARVKPAIGEALANSAELGDVIVGMVGNIATAQVTDRVESAGILTESKLYGPQDEETDYRFVFKTTNNTKTFVRFNAAGNLAPSGMRMLNSAGMPYFTPGPDGGFQMRTWAGNDTWFGVGADGMPTVIAKWALVNTIGLYGGPDLPFPYPGKTILWLRPDPESSTGIRAWEVSQDA